MAGTNVAIGKTTSAAISAWIAPDATFSIATAHTGIGASTRSSISRVYPNSCTIGSATDWMPWKMIEIAIDAGDEQRGEVGRAARAADRLADLREHVREHEDQQQRLHHRAAEEHPELLAQHGEVAQEQRAERACGPTAADVRALTPRVGGGGHSRRSFPVRLMKTVSSVGLA